MDHEQVRHESGQDGPDADSDQISSQGLEATLSTSGGGSPPILRPSAAFVTISTVAQMVLGLGLQMVLSWFFGARLEMDLYLVAVALPQLVQLVASSALTVSLPPAWTAWETAGRSEEALGAGFLTTAATSLVIAGGIALSAARLAPLLAPGIVSSGTSGLATALIRTLAPAIVAHCLVAYLTASAIARRRFALWPVAGTAAIAIQVLGTWLGTPKWGISAAAAAYLLSAIVQLVILAPYIPRRASSWGTGFSHLTVLNRTAGPVAVKTVVSRFTTVSDRWIASWLGAGAVSHVTYGTRLVQAAVNVLASGLASTILPDLSELAEKDGDGFKRSVVSGVRVMAFLAFPSAVLFIVFPELIVRLIYGRGAFLPRDVLATAAVLRSGAGWLAASVSGMPITMGLYALRSHRSVSVMSIATGLLNLLVSYVLSKFFGVWGIALAFSFTATLNLVILTILLKRRQRSLLYLPWGGLKDPNLVSLTFLSITLLIGRFWIPESFLYQGVVGPLSVLFASMLLYLGAAGLLQSEELTLILQALRKLFSWREPSVTRNIGR